MVVGNTVDWRISWGESSIGNKDRRRLTGGRSTEEVDDGRVPVLLVTIESDCASYSRLVASLLQLLWLVKVVWHFWRRCAGDRIGRMRRWTGGSVGVRIMASRGRTCHVVHT